jgi:hypothetical protein
VRVVAGVGRRTWCCRGRRAAASGFKKEVTINMLLGGRVARRGGGGGTASATAAVGNDNPRASRSAVAAFLARMDVLRAAAMLSRWRLQEQIFDGATRRGGRATRSVVITMEDDGDGWDLPPPPARRRWMRRCRCPLRPRTETTKTKVRDDAT